MIWRIQSGVDGLFYEDANSTVVGSVIANLGTVSSDVYSVFGSGKINTTGVGIGATATWYNDTGLYLDAQTGINWYITDMDSANTRTSLIHNNSAHGLAASLETGKNIRIDDHWSITPQAQLSYSNVDFNSFADRYGSDVSLQGSNNLTGRLGVSAAYSDRWADQMSHIVKSNIYAAGNLYYDFAGGSRILVSDVAFSNADAPLWAGIALGGSLSWADGQYSVYGEVLTQTSVKDFWKSNSLGVKAGVSMHW
jgi:fibronectin-binding autotransporter adhesin